MFDDMYPGEKTRRIDELINSNFENATPEDIKLYAEWQAQKALATAEFEARCKAHEEEAQVRIAIAEQRAQEAHEALDLLVSKALERYERLG